MPIDHTADERDFWHKLTYRFGGKYATLGDMAEAIMDHVYLADDAFTFIRQCLDVPAIRDAIEVEFGGTEGAQFLIDRAYGKKDNLRKQAQKPLAKTPSEISRFETAMLDTGRR